MLKAIVLNGFFACLGSAAWADEAFQQFDFADRDPDGFTAELLAKPSFGSTFPGARLAMQPPVARFTVPMRDSDGILYATLISASAIVWAAHAHHSVDEEAIAEVSVRFEWNEQASVTISFPATQIGQTESLVWVHGTLDRGLVISSSAGAEKIWPSCLRWYGRAARFCASVATDRLGYRPPI